MSNVQNGKWYFVVGGLTVIAIIAAIIVSAIPTAAARPTSQVSAGAPARSVTVVGSGSASAAPNLATAQIGVDTQAASPEEATSQNETQMQAVLAALQEAGIAEEDIQTAYYNLYAEQRYEPGSGAPTGEFTYRVSNSVSVKLRDLDQVGAILSDAVTAGANNISGVFFSIEDTTALQAEAREKAIADARTRAQSLAQLSGVELGEIVVVSEVITGGPGPIIYDRGAAGLGGGGGAPIQPGQLEVSMQVQVSFAIE
ncbi:MAG TPA: SIMPL domain-containing protein [Anaerolineae bacterium]|nr:SIMPL domain-containing protein [Anaerolineae bacterium]